MYVIQGVENGFGKVASADIRDFGRTCLLTMLLLIGLVLFCLRCFCLASKFTITTKLSKEVRHGHDYDLHIQ